MCGDVICYYKQITSVVFTDVGMEMIIHLSKQNVYIYTFSYIIQTTSIERYTVDYKIQTDESIQWIKICIITCLKIDARSFMLYSK